MPSLLRIFLIQRRNMLRTLIRQKTLPKEGGSTHIFCGMRSTRDSECNDPSIAGSKGRKHSETTSSPGTKLNHTNGENVLFSYLYFFDAMLKTHAPDQRTAYSSKSCGGRHYRFAVPNQLSN